MFVPSYLFSATSLNLDDFFLDVALTTKTVQKIKNCKLFFNFIVFLFGENTNSIQTEIRLLPFLFPKINFLLCNHSQITFLVQLLFFPATLICTNEHASRFFTVTLPVKLTTCAMVTIWPYLKQFVR